MFNLSFLNSGILALAAAVVIPLLIYLLARKKPRRVIFSSIKFIKLSQQKQHRKINLQNLLLLIIRMLIILLTVLAISRPSLKAPFLDPGNRHPRSVIGIIIDNSFSMDYLIDTRTELEIAKVIAQEINSLLAEDDITFLLTLDDEWNRINGNLNYGRMSPAQIDRIQITPQPVPMHRILEQAEKKIYEGQLPNREIYVISDFQDYQLPEKSDIPVFFIPTSTIQDKQNLSCQETLLLNQIVNRGIEQNIEAMVVNHGDSEQDDVILQLFLDGRTVAEKIINLNPGQRKQERFLVDMQTSSWHSGYVSVRNERLNYDNRNYFSFYYNNNPRVAVLSDRKKIPLVLETILEIYTGSSQDVEILDPVRITSDNLGDFDNLIIYDPGILTPRIELILERWQDNGRGIIYCTSSNLETTWQSFLADIFRLEFLGYQNSREDFKINYINKYHPATSLINTNLNLRINDFWQVSSSGNILLQAVDFPLAISKDRHVVWLFDIESKLNPFLVSSAFPVFAYNCLKQTLADQSSLSNQKVGDPILLRSRELTLPGGENIVLSQNRFIARDAGIYIIDGIPVAVNLNYQESDYRRWDKKNSNNLHFLNEEWQKEILQSRYGYELWKIILLLVILLVGLEMLLVKKAESRL